MYLKSIFIENNGPIRTLSLDIPFNADGTPRPVVLVGENGSGKTNLISNIADAIFEAAAAHYQNTLPSVGINRSWFRIIGPSTISVGAKGGFSILEFEHGGASYFFREKGGFIPPDEVKSRVPTKMLAAVDWSPEGSVKNFRIRREQVEKIFDEGAYVYFPASRAESPHWLNRGVTPEAGFDVELPMSHQLRKPIYVERGLEQFKQWLLSLLIDIRTHFQLAPSGQNGEVRIVPTGDPIHALTQLPIWVFCNQIIRTILCDNKMRFVWGGRHSPFRLAVAREADIVVPALEALSAGQATLLSVFGTLCRYGDISPSSAAVPQNVVGICLIDEIDSHMHVELQHRALPSLLRLFPNVQFVVSSHSPLFVLGMEREFGADGFTLLELPKGKAIDAESYGEFGRALDVMRESRAFSREVIEAASKPGKLLVLVEGETDLIYYRAALDLLHREILLEKLEIDWVGGIGPKGGQSFNTGAKGLDGVFNTLRANPKLMARPILLVYDQDIHKPEVSVGRLHVRRLPGEAKNSRVKAGVESLLSGTVFTDEFIDTYVIRKPNGDETTVKSIRKMELCKYLCSVKRDAADFEGFRPLVEMLEGICEAEQKQATPQPAP